MKLWQKFSNIRIAQRLRLAVGAKILLEQAGGAAPLEITLAEQAALDGVTAGTVTASKAVVVDANKDASTFRNVAMATLTADAIAGGDSSLGITGQAAAQGGEVVVTGGTSSTAGNVGGVASLVGGTPGATSAGAAARVVGAAGGATSGNGGNAEMAGGAGTAGNGNGGSVVLTPGANHGSGIPGGTFLRSATAQHFRQMAAPVAKADGNQSLTAAEMIGQIVVHTVTTGRTLTTPTGAAISAGCPAALAVGDSFDLHVITVGTGADDISTLTAGDGAVTFVGNVTVGPDASTFNGYGTFRFRNTGAGTWIGYRIG